MLDRPLRPFVLALSLAVAACGGSGSSSPTNPGPPLGPAPGASISGQVAVTGGGASFAPDLGAGSGRPAAVAGAATAATTAAGVVVRIEGTALATTTDGDGRFALGGVPSGDRVLLFETAQAVASLPVPGVRPNETIEISVTVSGSTATATDVQRDDADETPGDDEPDDPDQPDDPDDPDAPDAPDDEEIDLELDLSPDDWSLDYAHSSGTVTAFVRGDGFDRVDLSSLRLVGDDPAAAPLAPVSATREGHHVRARFAKSDALALLADPAPGSDHLVTLVLELVDAEGTIELTEEVSIEDEDEPEDEEEDEEEDDDEEDDEEEPEEPADQPVDVSLDLSPGSWNLNWAGSSGHLTAKLRGSGLARIDLDSIELLGDAPGAPPLAADHAALEGNHVRAQFPKAGAIELLDQPAKDSVHTVVVRFTADEGAETFELAAEIEVKGGGKGPNGGDGADEEPDDDEEDEEEDDEEEDDDD